MKYFVPGIPDSAFLQRKPEKGLITKAEIRALSLVRLAPSGTDVVWDIGTATGSVAIEAALMAPGGRVYAVEKNAEDVEIAKQNVARFKVENVRILHGKAPGILVNIPEDPHAVFVGGSGGEMPEVIEASLARLHTGGRLVINAITLDNLNAATSTLKKLGVRFDVTLAQIARSKPILDLLRFEALNPVFIISAIKKDSEEAIASRGEIQ